MATVSTACFCAVGFSGPFFDWGVAALRCLLANVPRGLDEVVELADFHPSVQMLIGIEAARHHPDLPLIVFLDKPDTALHSLCASGGDVGTKAPRLRLA